MRFSLIFISFIFSLESVDKYINQVLKGDISNAVLHLPDLESVYPNNPEVIFLSGLLDVKGGSAKQKFSYIASNHKGSKYAPDAIIKVSEYYYAAGLYMESAEWLKKIPQYYQGLENLDEVIKLFMNSLSVAGYSDSVSYYSEVFKKQLPEFEFEEIALQKQSYIDEAPNVKNAKPDEVENILPKESKNKESKNIIVRFQELLDKVKDDLTAPINEYSLQTGAFGKRSNAEQQYQVLLDAGYDARVESVNSNGILLYTVRLGYFSNRPDAVKEQKKISSSLGFNSVIINNE